MVFFLATSVCCLLPAYQAGVLPTAERQVLQFMKTFPKDHYKVLKVNDRLGQKLKAVPT
jgi:hypothetical protein